ncbi:MAG: thiamine phosphate synthase [Candidatus Acidiferrales bacterium]
MIKRSSRPILCYVTDRRGAPGATANSDSTSLLSAVIERAIAAGVDWTQVREKDLDARPLENLVRTAVKINAGRARIFVNDRLDIALASDTDGVHLGENSLPAAGVAAWRAGAGRPNFTIGVSCHSPEAVRAAEDAGADYIFFGPIFATPSKASFGPAQGVERLRAACRGARIPVLAIGGITESNAVECLAAGAAGIAAIRMFQDEGDLAGIVSRLHALKSARAKNNFGEETSR